MPDVAVCPHGELSPACCLDCLEGPRPDPRPLPEERLLASAWVTAKLDTRCARNPAHSIDEGDRIGLLDDFGWSCTECARPIQPEQEER